MCPVAGSCIGGTVCHTRCTGGHTRHFPQEGLLPCFWCCWCSSQVSKLTQRASVARHDDHSVTVYKCIHMIMQHIHHANISHALIAAVGATILIAKAAVHKRVTAGWRANSNTRWHSSAQQQRPKSSCFAAEVTGKPKLCFGQSGRQSPGTSLLTMLGFVAEHVPPCCISRVQLVPNMKHCPAAM